MSPDIQKLRYDFHLKQLKKTVATIREAVKRPNELSYKDLKTIKRINSINPSNSRFPDIEIPNMTYKQKKLLLTTISDFESEQTYKLKSVRSEPNMITSAKDSETVDKFKTLSEKQKENLKKIQKEQERMQGELFKKLSKSMKDHIEREQLMDEYKKIQLKEKEELILFRKSQIKSKIIQENEDMEELIQEKLDKIDRKIQKSKELYNEEIKKKIDKAIKLRDAADVVAKKIQGLKLTNEVEQVNKMVDKQMHVHEARLKIEDKIRKIAMKKKKKFEKQRKIALDKIQETEKEILKKSNILESRILKSQQIVLERKEKILKDLAFRQELQKLKEQEKYISVQRAKRKFVI